VISGHGPSAQGLIKEGVVAVMLDGARVRKKAITTKTVCAAKKTIVLRLGIIFWRYKLCSIRRPLLEGLAGITRGVSVRGGGVSSSSRD
jgi:hypothetical protein